MEVRMPSNKDIQNEIDLLQSRMDQENDQAEQERQAAEQADADNNPGEAQRHRDASSRHERTARGYESDIENLTIRMQQQQQQIAKIQERRSIAEQTYTAEIARYDAEIQQLSGE